MNTPIKHIIFDLDNTLWDFSGNSKKILKNIFTEFELPQKHALDFEKFLAQYKFRNENLWKEYAFGKVTRDEVRFNRFYLTFNDFGINNYKLASDAADFYISHTKNQTELLPHAIHLLDYLFEKYQLHIITNGFEEVQIFKLKNSGIAHYFKTVTTAEAAQSLKPDKKIFDYAMHKMQAVSNECVYIGDTPEVDGKGAVNAGMDFIWFIQNESPNDYDFKKVYSLSEIMNLL